MVSQPSAKSKKGLKWLFFLAFIFIFSFVLVSISLFYFLVMYDTKRITGEWFLPGKPVKSFHSSWSFHGDGSSVEILNIPKHLQKYFTNPPQTFFDYPLVPLSRKIFHEGFLVKNWTSGTPTREEVDFIRKELKNWNVPNSLVDEVITSLTIETSYHAYCYVGRATNLIQSYASFDFFILDPINGHMIIITEDS